MGVKADSAEVGVRARRRIACRILPFVFVLYLVAYIDRVNVAFASLRMNADLGFTDTAFGLGSGIFYVGYVLFEIPGALLVERRSARKWIGRIMLSWGLVTVLTGFVQTRGQFYVARLLLGVAEASFFPGMIVYLSRWFGPGDRSRAFACLYAANPTASILGAPLAGWLLAMNSPALAGWRRLFIVEGIPAILLGTIAFFYLTDWPGQASWLPQRECDWLAGELHAELEAKIKWKSYTIGQAFRDRQILLMTFAFFLTLSGALGNVYWLPAFVKRLSGLSVKTVTSLLVIPGLIGVAGILLNGWHSDKTRERRCHASIPLVIAGMMYGLAALIHNHSFPGFVFLLLGTGFLSACFPVFWSIPASLLSGTAAAATFGLINSIGQLGGLFGPWAIGALNDRTHSLTPAFTLLALLQVCAGALILTLKIRDPTRDGTREGVSPRPANRSEA